MPDLWNSGHHFANVIGSREENACNRTRQDVSYTSMNVCWSVFWTLQPRAIGFKITNETHRYLSMSLIICESVLLKMYVRHGRRKIKRFSHIMFCACFGSGLCPKCCTTKSGDCTSSLSNIILILLVSSLSEGSGKSISSHCSYKRQMGNVRF